ncbi:MAG: histidine phosphatase family protein [Acidobacteria bacterium]|nr:histidine phosphatase family protein [Acidobacteriota bacterium]
MKTLFILRHAKSSWDDPNLADFERPLNQRGQKAAPFMGELMTARKLVPDLIMSSPARRARETAELVKKNGDLDGEIVFEEKIYEAGPSALLKVIANLDERFECVLLVGHNPVSEELVRILTGRSESMPTAALAVIDLNIGKWADIAAQAGTLRFVIKPKQEMKH